MQDRNLKVKEQLLKAIESDSLPDIDDSPSLQDVGLTAKKLIDLFESQVMSRHLDLRSRLMQKQGQSFYTIGSAGHEGNAACAMAFRPDDMAFLHYRSAAFMIQRSKQVPNQTPLYDMLLSFAASSDDPISGGRHKVLGSKSLFIPPQTSTIASHLPKAVGTAFSIGLSRRVEVNNLLPKDSIVVCNFGDASANHSTAQGAINAASWAAFQSVPLPLVFICEDNGIGISTATPKGWIQANFEHRAGLEYLQCDGLNLLDTYQKSCQAADIARKRHKPVFLHIRTVRLLGHAGSDSEFSYRSQESIEASEALDPLLFSAQLLLKHGCLDSSGIKHMYNRIEQNVEEISQQVSSKPKLTDAQQIKKSIVPPKLHTVAFSHLNEPARKTLFEHEQHNLGKKQHLAKLLNWAMLDLMAEQSNIVMCGEDIGKKGGVYNVTSRLADIFGSRRVINTLLDEQSILGMAIGLAHNGFLPIPEIQFLAYVHNAEDQIRGEAATLSFFSDGQFTNPMVIRIAGLAYQKGFGGHFHNDNSFAVFRDIPGLIIVCPSNGADAVEMLRESVRLAQEEQRVVIFIEPIALYMQKDLHLPSDGLWSFDYVKPVDAVPIIMGEIGSYGTGKDLCIISYANGYYLSLQAEKILAEQNTNSTVIDLRWLAPLNISAIVAAIGDIENILIVDECRQTGSLSEALVTLLIENLPDYNNRNIQRLTAHDSFIPLGSASYAVLPSCELIVKQAQQMLE
jgi:2-oxoisovalerate dehydrogenase E1 component